MSDTSSENPGNNSSAPSVQDSGFDDLEALHDAPEGEAVASTTTTAPELNVDDDEDVPEFDTDSDVDVNYTPSKTVSLHPTSDEIVRDIPPLKTGQHALDFPSLEPDEYEALILKLAPVFELYNELDQAARAKDKARYDAVRDQLNNVPRKVRQQVYNLQRCAGFFGSLPGQLFNGEDWGNAVEHEGKRLVAGKARHNSKDPISVINSQLGIGGNYRFPMWHSGMWLTFKQPAGGDLLDLDQMQQLEKEMLGRYSYGLTYSNTEVYTTTMVVDFALRHLVETSMGTLDPETIKRKLLVTDIPLILQDLATVLYPKGYPLTQPCLAKVNCGHVNTRIASLQRMVIVRRSMLSHEQRRLMARITAGTSENDVRDYQARMRPEIDRKIPLNDEGTSYLRLAVPTVFEQEVIGMQWVDGVVDSVRNAFGARLSERDRISLIEQKVALTDLMTRCHWIEALVTVEESATPGEPAEEIVLSRRDELHGAENSTKLDKFLVGLCESDNQELKDRIAERLDQFMMDMTVAYTAVPKVPCTKCGEMPDETGREYKMHPRLITIDPGTVFFILRRQYLEKRLTPNG